MSRGFGISSKGKAKSRPMRKFTFQYRSTDGCLNLVEIEETSAERAAQQFCTFVADLEQALSLLADKGGEHGK